MRSETALRWLDRLLLIELVALTFVLGCFLDKDTDIWWHLRAGREILGGAGIPRVDSYIFAAPGADWIDLHWGFQAIAWWLFSRGGFAALTLAAAAAGALAVFVAAAATSRDRSFVAVVWCWVPAVFVMSARFFPRPEILSLVFLATFVYILNAANTQPKRLWMLVPLQLAWVNTHALFVLGLILLGCWLVDRIIAGKLTLSRDSLRDLVAAPVAVVLVCFANPYGWNGALFPLTLFRRMSSERGFYAQHIGELMSLPDLVLRTGISSIYVRLSLFLLAAAAGSFALRRTERPLIYFRALSFLLFAGLGLLAMRNQPQFALIAGAVLAWNVGDWLAARRQPPIIDRAVSRILTSAALVGLIFWVSTGGFYAYAAEGRVVGLGEHPSWYAHAAAAFAAREEMPRHFVAYHEGQAAVLEFHMRPDQQVFVDPRLEVSPRRGLEQYYELAAAMTTRDVNWDRNLAGLPQPLGMLIDHDTHYSLEAALLVDRRWRCVWFDAVAGVYVPASETQLVNRYAINFADRLLPEPAPTAAGPSLEKLFAAERLLKVGGSLPEDDPVGRQTRRILMLLAANTARGVMAAEPRRQGPARLIAQASADLYKYPMGEITAESPPEALLGLARARFFLAMHLRLAPSDFESWLMLFSLGSALGDPDAVWEPALRLTQMTATNVAQYEIQRQVRAVLRRAAAVRATDAALRPPLDAAEALTTARQLVGERRFLRALEVIERWVASGAGLAPGSWELTDLRATLLLAAGEPARAAAVWTSSADANARRPLLARRLANAYFVQGRLDEAAQSYQAALAADPAQPVARYGLAITHLELGDRAAFVRECATALQSEALHVSLADYCRDMLAAVEPATPSTDRDALSTKRPGDNR